MSTTTDTSAATPKAEKYGSLPKTRFFIGFSLISHSTSTVRLGNSGLKISRIILGSLSHMGVDLRSPECLLTGYYLRMHDLRFHHMAKVDVG